MKTSSDFDHHANNQAIDLAWAVRYVIQPGNIDLRKPIGTLIKDNNVAKNRQEMLQLWRPWKRQFQIHSRLAENRFTIYSTENWKSPFSLMAETIIISLDRNIAWKTIYIYIKYFIWYCIPDVKLLVADWTVVVFFFILLIWMFFLRSFLKLQFFYSYQFAHTFTQVDR